MDKGVIDKKLERSMYTTFLASTFRTLRFGLGQTHAKGIAMQVNNLFDHGAIRVAADGRFSIDVAKAKKAVTDLTHDIMTIQATGDYKAADALLKKNGGGAAGSAARARQTRRRPGGHRAPPRHGGGADPPMKLTELSALEARVIGCLIEKQITTPDQYPLSLNALVNACNQKSNRDPLMDVDEPTVQRTLDDLGKKHLIVDRSGFGSRVPKYQHRFCNTEFGTLKLSPQEVAIVCELLLRGPQTPGELRPRAARMAPFGDTDQVEAILEGLRTREDGPFVVRLARQAGRRDSQWAHLFSGPVDAGVETDVPAVRPAAPAMAANPVAVAPSGTSTPETSRIERLESEVRQLREELDSLKKQLGV